MKLLIMVMSGEAELLLFFNSLALFLLERLKVFAHNA